MGLNRRDFTALTLAATLATRTARAQARMPLIIARGAAEGEWPEGTQGAYEAAMAQGADFIEASLVVTRDGFLVARRDNELSTSTDVASRPEFADRKTSKTFDGVVVEGWFSETFTLAELKTLACGAAGRASRRKAAGATMLTLKDIINLARSGSVRAARVIGVCARVVRPGYFASIDLAMEPRLADAVRANGYDSPAAAMFVESFEPRALKTIGSMTRVRRVQLIDGDPRHADMISSEGLQAVRAYAEAIGPAAALALDPQAAPSALVGLAHGAGLAVHAWTGDTVSSPPFRRGDLRGYLKALFAAGVDGLGGDAVALAVKARAEARRQTPS